MLISLAPFTCPKCRKPSVASAEQIGKYIRCSTCAMRVLVPAWPFEPDQSDPTQALASRLVTSLAYLLDEPSQTKAYYLLLAVLQSATGSRSIACCRS